MKIIIKPLLLSLAVAMATGIFAQDKEAPAEKKLTDVIIRKKGDSKEKMTIVIDGDKVTINGRPAEDYKSDDIEILHDDDMTVAPYPPMAALAPGSAWSGMGKDFMREIHSNKAFLGVMTKKGTDGAEITEVTKESAAEKAGLKEADIITKINDTKVADADDLYEAISEYKPEEKVSVTYKRGGKENKMDIKLGENKQVKVFSWNGSSGPNFKYDSDMSPKMRGFNYFFDNKPRLGIQVQETEDNKGVKVLDVDNEGPAGLAGLEEEDIITTINGKSVVSLETIKEVMKDAKEGDAVKLDILREGKAQALTVKFPKELKTTDL